MRICTICLKSDFLCTACNRKLQTGKITELEMKVQKALYGLQEGTNFLKVAENDDVIIITADKENVRKIIGRGGRTVKALSSKLGKTVRIIEQEDEKQMIEKILRTPLIAINIKYGDFDIHRLRIEKKFQKKTDMKLIQMLEIFFNKKFEIVFE